MGPVNNYYNIPLAPTGLGDPCAVPNQHLGKSMLPYKVSEVRGFIPLAAVKSKPEGCPQEKKVLLPNKSALLVVIVHLAPTEIKAGVRCCQPMVSVDRAVCRI